MPYLSTRDLTGLDALLRRLYQCRREEAFATTAIDGVQALIGARQTTWNRIGPDGAVVVATPKEQEHELHQAALSDLLAEHPLLRHRLATDDLGAHMISDFVSRREYHRSALYQRLYRELRYEDLMAAFLPGGAGPAGEIVLAIGREKANFSERDRVLCDLVRPHIAAAYRHAAALSRYYRRLEWRALKDGGPMQAVVRLDGRGRILEAPARASRWIREYYGLARGAGHLPDELEIWLRAGNGAPATIEARRDESRLTIRFDCDTRTHEIKLLLEKRRTDVNESGALTARERRILQSVEQGLRNQDIAAALGITVATVKKHLEHVFEKLGVTNRTAAVRRWRQVGEVGSRLQ